MSPKDIRKISLPEPDLITRFVSEDTWTHGHTKTAPWVDSPRGSTENTKLISGGSALAAQKVKI